MLFQPIEGFNIIKLAPYRASKSLKGTISKTDLIAFMTKFYPPPLHAKLILVQPQTSGSSKNNSQKSFKESQASDSIYHSQQKSFSQQNNIKEYEVSEIKPPNKGFVTHSRKLRETSLKCDQNEESEFQYRQLLLDLSFQQKHDKSVYFEQKPKDKYYFELSERNYSQQSLNNNIQDQLINEEKERLSNHKILNNSKWDSNEEILFRKQIKIKRMIIVLNKKCLQTQKDIVENLKKVGTIIQTNKEKSLQKFLWNKRRKQNQKIFKVQVAQIKIEENR